MYCKLWNVLIIVLCVRFATSVVLELDDRFREAKKQGEWLVMFYAPWCGHCKQLEPTWMEVGEAMEKPVHVARLDCTKYSSLSGDFGVRGFPTIKFISGDNEYEYRGARTKRDIIGFARKARGPKVTHITKSNDIAKARYNHSVFFVYVGDEESDLSQVYNSVAEKLFLTLNMFKAPSKILPDVKDTPTVLVYKDDTYYSMPLSHQSISQSHLSHWMLSEQLPDYVELTGSTYHSLKGTHKLFAVVVLPESDFKELDNVARDIATSRDALFHPKFIFCWVLGNSIMNKITYNTIPMPNFVVFNPNTYEYYTLRREFTEAKIEKSDVVQFLSNVMDGEISVQGGSGVFQQIKRFISDTTSVITNFFRESPIIATLVIGIPTFIITFLCYCLCTMEDTEGGEYNTDSENDSGEDEEEIEKLPEYEDDREKGVRKRNIEQDSQGEESQAEESQDEGESPEKPEEKAPETQKDK